MAGLDQRVARRLEALRSRGLERRCPLPTRRRGVAYTLDGQPVIGFCSNDYLGLASGVIASDLPENTSTGATASRLICGDSDEHRALERSLAALVDHEDAVLFSSGYAANVGALPALLEPGDRVFSDALNHASIIDGLRLARARPTIIPHRRAPEHISIATGPTEPATWWVTESVYSMDGDVADPAAITRHLARGGFVYLDEAHSLGLFAGGAGFARHRGIKPSVIIGTLGKAFACAGAFVAGSRAVTELLRSTARSFVFSTGVSPLLVAAIKVALERVVGPDGDRRRERLWTNIARLAERLELEGPPPCSPIFPIHVGDNELAVRVSRELLARGWHVQAIRPPTVPEGTARLRVTVCADHSAEQIDRFAHDLRAAFSTHLGLRPQLRRARAS